MIRVMTANDYDEVKVYNTDPTKVDTDGDGIEEDYDYEKVLKECIISCKIRN